MLLVAHGSTDARFNDVVSHLAVHLRERRPDLDVRIAYLDHGPPSVADVAEPGAVAVPLLLSSGYHVRVDLPAQAPDVVCARAVGPDPRLADALADRLAEAGWDGRSAVTLAAAGSGDDVATQATLLATRLGVDVRPAAASEFADVTVVASYLLAPGVFYDAVLACGASVVSAPIGAHPAVVDIVLDRYDEAVAQVPGRTAPA